MTGSIQKGEYRDDSDYADDQKFSESFVENRAEENRGNEYPVHSRTLREAALTVNFKVT